jgi:diaminohydroxyphosphoribosylaminopyrimidine deaminase/5-amino-6-(5-phosphoribosylamino)uracil reductase
MHVLRRARSSAPIPRAQRAAAFDRAVQEFFMRLALEEARRAVGRTSPNPAVGAVLVRNGRVVGRGYTAPAGGPHAEVRALRAAGSRARGADLYSTLEPCVHYGRTPPCTDAILRAGVRRVVCATVDPHPLVDGKGIRQLRRGGVEVRVGVLREEAEALNRPFFKVVRTGLPWVTVKAAITLDGKIATASGDSRWVTSEASRHRVHALRDQADAVMVGRGTTAVDDPRLTARVRGGRDPVRIVLDSRLNLPARRKVFSTRVGRAVVATLQRATHPRASHRIDQGVEIWTLPSRRGRVDLRELLRRAASAGLNHVLVEGGAEVFASLFEAGLVDEVLLFIAPKIVGARGRSWVGALPVQRMSRAHPMSVDSVERVGPDLLIRLRNFPSPAGGRRSG